MYGQPLGEVAYSGFGAGISGDLGQWSVGIHRGNIQNRNILFAQHVRGKDLGRDQGAQEVELEHEFHPIWLEVKESLDVFPINIPLFIDFLVCGGTGVVAACTI